jgi:cytochrome c biogenesis protein CcmG/thiol:disulfide interchange protein DsbE
MRKLLSLLPLILFLVLVGYFSLSLREGPRDLPSALINQPAPNFVLPPLGMGDAVSLASLKGRVTVVNFFASWCVPCRLEQPMLMRLAKQDKIPIIGVAYKDRAQDAEKLLDDAGDPYSRVGLDESGRTGIDFGVYGVPETYVIDKEGRIRRRFVGPLTPDAVAKELLPLLRRLRQP